jgi:hypothetical protein
VEKLVWVPVISICKIFIPSSAFDALLCQNWPFSLPNRLTLGITLISKRISGRLPRWNHGTQLLIRVVSSFTTLLWIMGLQWIVHWWVLGHIVELDCSMSSQKYQTRPIGSKGFKAAKVLTSHERPQSTLKFLEAKGCSCPVFSIPM